MTNKTLLSITDLELLLANNNLSAELRSKIDSQILFLKEQHSTLNNPSPKPGFGPSAPYHHYMVPPPFPYHMLPPPPPVQTQQVVPIIESSVKSTIIPPIPMKQEVLNITTSNTSSKYTPINNIAYHWELVTQYKGKGKIIIYLQSFLNHYSKVRYASNWKEKLRFSNAEMLMALLINPSSLKVLFKDYDGFYDILIKSFKHYLTVNQDFIVNFIKITAYCENNTNKKADLPIADDLKELLNYLEELNTFYPMKSTDEKNIKFFKWNISEYHRDKKAYTAIYHKFILKQLNILNINLIKASNLLFANKFDFKFTFEGLFEHFEGTGTVSDGTLYRRRFQTPLKVMESQAAEILEKKNSKKPKTD